MQANTEKNTFIRARHIIGLIMIALGTVIYLEPVGSVEIIEANWPISATVYAFILCVSGIVPFFSNRYRIVIVPLLTLVSYLIATIELIATRPNVSYAPMVLYGGLIVLIAYFLIKEAE